jgi:hypothetical protein
MKNYCNANRSNAQKDICINWCKTNSTDCTELNLIKDCKKYDLDICTNQNVIDVQTDCRKYGLESEQGLRLYGCNPKGISKFKNECTENNVSLDICTPMSLQDAKQNKFSMAQLKVQESAVKQSEKNYQETKAAIGNVLALSTDEAQSQPQTQKISLEYYISIFIICLCIILSSGLLIFLF